jgi:hypothetical protein
VRKGQGVLGRRGGEENCRVCDNLLLLLLNVVSCAIELSVVGAVDRIFDEHKI